MRVYVLHGHHCGSKIFTKRKKIGHSIRRIKPWLNTSLDARADALERKMSDELDVLLSKSALFNMADGQLGASGIGILTSQLNTASII